MEGTTPRPRVSTSDMSTVKEAAKIYPQLHDGKMWELEWMWADSGLFDAQLFRWAATKNPLRWTDGSPGDALVAMSRKTGKDASRPILMRDRGSDETGQEYATPRAAADWVLEESRRIVQWQVDGRLQMEQRSATRAGPPAGHSLVTSEPEPEVTSEPEPEMEVQRPRAAAAARRTCRIGSCDRVVAPGTYPKTGRPFNTCCRNCGTNIGGHDDECNMRHVEFTAQLPGAKDEPFGPPAGTPPRSSSSNSNSSTLPSTWSATSHAERSPKVRAVMDACGRDTFTMPRGGVEMLEQLHEAEEVELSRVRSEAEIETIEKALPTLVPLLAAGSPRTRDRISSLLVETGVSPDVLRSSDGVDGAEHKEPTTRLDRANTHTGSIPHTPERLSRPRVSSVGSPVLSPVQITHLVRENSDLKEQLERQRESAHVVESFIGA